MSIVFHPFVMVAVFVVAVGLHVGSAADAVRALLLVALVVVLPIGVLMVRQVRRGSWGNVDASNREERPILFVVGVVALAVLAACAVVFRPASFLARGGLVVLVMVAVCAVINRWLKISLHTAFAALVTTTLVLLGSPAGWFLVPVVPALAWSRLALGRHRLPEVLAGLVVGTLSGYVLYRI
jgi:membrane-associated phospholipid phosphatase